MSLSFKTAWPWPFPWLVLFAGVRFRHTLKSPADTLPIFIAIGVGLAAGVKGISIALIMTVFFNYTFLILWMLDYGNITKKRKKYMRNSRSKSEIKKVKNEKQVALASRKEG